jgi:hypothetical protein
MKRDLSKPLASTYGDPIKKMKKIKAEPLISPTQHAKNTKGYAYDAMHHNGKLLTGGFTMRNQLKNPENWSADGKVSSKSGYRRKDWAASASTVDKRFSNANDTKKLLKKKK